MCPLKTMHVGYIRVRCTSLFLPFLVAGRVQSFFENSENSTLEMLSQPSGVPRSPMLTLSGRRVSPTVAEGGRRMGGGEGSIDVAVAIVAGAQAQISRGS